MKQTKKCYNHVVKEPSSDRQETEWELKEKLNILPNLNQMCCSSRKTKNQRSKQTPKQDEKQQNGQIENNKDSVKVKKTK